MQTLLKDQTNNHIIKVEIKNHYGQDHIYILSDHKDFIQQLTDRKTITQRDISALKALGFKFEVGLTPIEL